MSDDLAAQIETAIHAVDDVIVTLHEREMRAFHVLHDEEGHCWAGNVDQLMNVRDLIRRSAFITGNLEQRHG